jgi:two-component system phosphate regulon sensor histidine kinase PhoR
MARTIGRRLRDRRWALSASAVALLAVHGAGAGAWTLLATALAALFAVVASSPEHAAHDDRPSPPAGIAEAEGLNELTAEYLAAAVADPLIIFDVAGAIVHANAAAFAAFGGIAPGMALALRFRAPEMQALLDGVLSGTVASKMVDYTEKLPVERTYRVSASTVGHGTGLYVLVFKDQSETRRIDRMRADFIANASHELRTPLASVAGFIETLRGPARNDAAARDQFLEIMGGQTSRMARLIDDLLSLSRLEMKPYLASETTVDITKIVSSVIDSLAPLAADNGIAVERHFAENIPAIPGDRDELFQVFENLFENACKYGQQGGRVAVSIAQGYDAPGPSVDVTVRDFGPGIAEEHIPRVTERFYRIEAESGRQLKGTGLGLAIVKHILTRHNARLTIWSQPGQGAAFTVHLPIAGDGPAA